MASPVAEDSSGDRGERAFAASRRFATRDPPSLIDEPAGGYRQVAKWLTILLLAVHAIPILFSPGRALIIVILATIGLYFPASLMDKASEEKAK